jgi:hypothetical protein
MEFIEVATFPLRARVHQRLAGTGWTADELAEVMIGNPERNRWIINSILEVCDEGFYLRLRPEEAGELERVLAARS